MNRPKWLAAVAGTLLGLLGVDQYVLSPLLERHARADQAIERLQADLRELDRKIGRVAVMRSAIAHASEGLKNLDQVQLEKMLGELLDKIPGKRTVVPKPEPHKSALFDLFAFSISGQEPIGTIRDILMALSYWPQYVRVRGVTIDAQKTGRPTYSIDLAMLMLDRGARPPPAQGARPPPGFPENPGSDAFPDLTKKNVFGDPTPPPATEVKPAAGKPNPPPKQIEVQVYSIAIWEDGRLRAGIRVKNKHLVVGEGDAVEAYTVEKIDREKGIVFLRHGSTRVEIRNGEKQHVLENGGGAADEAPPEGADASEAAGEGESSLDPAEAGGEIRLGIVPEELTREKKNELNLQGLRRWQGGLIVLRVESGSAASRAGIRAGDILVEFNGARLPLRAPWKKLTDLLGQVKKNTDVPLAVLRNGERVELTARW